MSYIPWSKEKVIEFAEIMQEEFENAKAHEIDYHVYISPPNEKNAPHSVSLLPVVDCESCGLCAKGCYDLRHDVIYKNVRKQRVINSVIAHLNPVKYFREISGRCQSLDRFRWHIGGDILNEDYWCGMVRVANENPHCKFHVFTKRYTIINQYLDDGHTIPDNINLRLSQWSNFEVYNPHGLNICRVALPNEVVKTDAHSAVCNGDCTRCAIHSDGCFNRDYRTIIIPAH